MAELVDALDLGSSIERCDGFESLYPDHESVGVSLIKSDARHSERGWILLLNYHRQGYAEQYRCLGMWLCHLKSLFNKENESK